MNHLNEAATELLAVMKLVAKETQRSPLVCPTANEQQKSVVITLKDDADSEELRQVWSLLPISGSVLTTAGSL